MAQRAALSGDLLARLGGEDFGLLMLGGDAAFARRGDRTPARTIYGQTCSAGFAVRRPERSGAVVMRADAALYEAKIVGPRPHA